MACSRFKERDRKKEHRTEKSVGDIYLRRSPSRKNEAEDFFADRGGRVKGNITKNGCRKAKPSILFMKWNGRTKGKIRTRMAESQKKRQVPRANSEG